MTLPLHVIIYQDTRLAFLHKNEFLSVELVPCDCGGILDNGFSGAIFIRLSIEGPLLTRISHLGTNELEEIQMNIERQQKSIENLNYEQYQVLKSWYTQCRSSYPFIEDRKVKLMSLDECGRHRMVCNFIGKIKPPRDMDSPRFAARCVSLIPFYRGVELIGANVSSWNSSFSTMCKLQGDVEDHAILLVRPKHRVY